MSGLIWSALGQSLGNASATVGNFMMRAEQDEERQRERAELQRERLAATEREKERDRQLRIELNAQRGGDSSGGLSGDALDEAAAGEAGMSVPEYRASRERFKTGDMSALKRDVQKVSLVDTGDPYAPDATSTTVNEVPKWLEQEERAKWKTIERLRVKYSMGEKYKGMTEGEQNDFETGVGQGVIAGTMNRDVAAGAVGAMKGMGAYKESGGSVIDQYRGGPGVSTAVGESQRQENLAQAAKYGEDAKRISDRSDPETMRIRADYTQRERTLRTQIGKAFGADKEQLQSQLDELIAERKAFDEQVSAPKNNARKPSAAPAPAASSAAGGFKVGDTRSVASGPNKGKTVRWDGRGWVLVD